LEEQDQAIEIKPPVTIKAMADGLNLPASTLYGAAAAGKVRTIRFGRTYRIPYAEYLRVLREGWE
jgi:excisionase family DNA binding protein